MTAVLIDSRRTGSAAARRTAPSHLALYRSGQAGGASAISRGASSRALPRRPEPAVYRRRRLLAAGLLLLALAAVLVVAQLVQAGIGGGPLTTTGAAAGPGMIQAGATQYVVRPGDTLWSIAAALEPGQDERPLVDRLAKEVGGSSLYPGEVIPIPAGH